MNVLSATVSSAAETIPRTLDISLLDTANLLPFVAVSLVSLVGISLWLLAVSGYVSSRSVRTSC